MIVYKAELEEPKDLAIEKLVDNPLTDDDYAALAHMVIKAIEVSESRAEEVPISIIGKTIEAYYQAIKRQAEKVIGETK
jgi:hypothetical protein